jgi:hypothetical protein
MLILAVSCDYFRDILLSAGAGHTRPRSTKRTVEGSYPGRSVGMVKLEPGDAAKYRMVLDIAGIKVGQIFIEICTAREAEMPG